jgi:flagellar protein FlaF
MMQGALPESEVNMSYAAYQTAARVAEQPRMAEQRIFAQVTAALERVRGNDNSAEVAQACFDNCRLWNALADDLNHDGNGLPEDLKARLISLAIWVNKHTGAVLRGEARLDALIDVNRSIIRGLTAEAGVDAQPEGTFRGAQA